MNSFTTADFWKAYAELSPSMKEQAQKAYRLWLEDPLYPSLHLRKLVRIFGLRASVVGIER